ncbi:MAG: hypothetical protein K8F91_04815 [Candidatus Obscuribacterales bacterium]|nr:hypothetical protein [Candidatus Obscuribacterales bacterium]
MMKLFVRKNPAKSANRPDQSCIAIDANGNEVGGYGIWYKDTPHLNRVPVGCIGNYRARDAAVGVELLHQAVSQLQEKGIEQIVGPMNGNTWHSYRLTTEGFSTPPFALETITRKEYVEHFIAAGFEPLAHYASSIIKIDPCFDTGDNELFDSDITIRRFNKKKPYADLKAMYDVSLDAFANNFLYTPIEKDQFVSMYAPIIQAVTPELVLIAEHEKKAVGFIFAIPNITLAQNRDDAVVIKTLARISDPMYKGLGLRLVDQCHKNAYALGYKKMINALYKDDNTSSSFSTGCAAEVLRRYALYAKKAA